MTWDILRLVIMQRVGKSDMIKNTEELRECVWSKIGDRLKSRRIDMYGLKNMNNRDFTGVYNQAWDVTIKEMGL